MSVNIIFEQESHSEHDAKRRKLEINRFNLLKNLQKYYKSKEMKCWKKICHNSYNWHMTDKHEKVHNLNSKQEMLNNQTGTFRIFFLSVGK